MAVTKGVTTAGITELVKLTGAFGSPVEFDYIAVGEGSGAYAAGDTALTTEITTSGLERVQVTPTAAATHTIQWTNDFSVTGSKTITELGILNDATTGDLLLRIAGLSTDVENGYTYTPTITMKFTSA